MNQPKMVAQQDDHNQTLALISKLLGPQQSSNILHVPPPIQPPSNLRSTAYLPFPNGPSYPLYPQASSTAASESRNGEAAKDNKLSSQVSVPRKGSKYSDIDNPGVRKSRKRRHPEDSSTKASVFDSLMATHGNQQPGERKKSGNTESHKRMGKQIRDILTSKQPPKPPKPSKSRADTSSGKKEKKRKHKKSRSDKNVDYGDLVELLPSRDTVATKRRKIQENVRSKRDSAVEKKDESIYDYLHYDADTIPALQEKRNRILSALNKQPEQSIDATLQQIEREANDDVFSVPVTPITPEKRVGIRGSLSRPPSPKPSASEIQAVLEDMEEGELSEDEEQYNKLLHDVDSVSTVEHVNTEPVTPVKESKPSPAKSNIPPPIVPQVQSSPLKTIPFFSIREESVSKPDVQPSILDDLAFLNSIKTKYTDDTVPAAKPRAAKDTSRDLIQQLIRADNKISVEREKQRRNKEKLKEYEKRERERHREERRREKENKEQQRKHDALNYRDGTNHAKVTVPKPAKPDPNKLKQDFANSFIKGVAQFEGTLTKSTIDESVLSEERVKRVEELVETNEHRFDNGLVIQTSRSKVDEEELAAKTIPVKYNYKEVTEEYPAHAVAGAIAYRLREGKLKLIHRIVERIGKKPALDLLFETEEIEKNGGQMTNRGDRRKLPGGVFIGLLKTKLPKDDIKYIFTVENELCGNHEYLRKKQQNRDKRRRYNNNKTERCLSNALTSVSLNTVPSAPSVSLDSITVPAVPEVMSVAKPAPFITSFVLKQEAKESYVTLPKGPDEEGIKRIANIKKGYGAFVKKGACDGPVFQPSVTSTLSTESNTFDLLLRSHKATKDEEEMNEDSPALGPGVPGPGVAGPGVAGPGVPGPGVAQPYLQLPELPSSRADSLLAKITVEQPAQLPPTAEPTMMEVAAEPNSQLIVAAAGVAGPSVEQAMSEGELSEGELSME